MQWNIMRLFFESPKLRKQQGKEDPLFLPENSKETVLLRLKTSREISKFFHFFRIFLKVFGHDIFFQNSLPTFCYHLL